MFGVSIDDAIVNFDRCRKMDNFTFFKHLSFWLSSVRQKKKIPNVKTNSSRTNNNNYNTTPNPMLHILGVIIWFSRFSTSNEIITEFIPEKNNNNNTKIESNDRDDRRFSEFRDRWPLYRRPKTQTMPKKSTQKAIRIYSTC